MNRRTRRLLVACLILITKVTANADPLMYEDEFVAELSEFINLNRLSIGRLHRDKHADCYIPLTVSTTVLADGTVKDAWIVESSSVPVVDRYFLWAIQQTAPFASLMDYYDPVPAEITITREFRLDVRLWNDGIASTQPCEALSPPDSEDAGAGTE